jgi:exodeoxyribonuclease VII small subunit
MPEPSNGAEPESLTVEQAYAELEQTAQALQQGQLSLDDTLKLYERGSFLSRYCLQKLEGVELKVSQLLSHGDGTFSTRPITSEKDVTPPEPPAPEPPSAEPEDLLLKEQKELFE